MTASNFLGSDSYLFTLCVISKWFICLHTIGVNSKCGCPGGSTGRDGLGFITQRTLVRIPEQEEKSTPAFPAHPSVKRVPGLVLGSKVHWLCLIDH